MTQLLVWTMLEGSHSLVVPASGHNYHNWTNYPPDNNAIEWTLANNQTSTKSRSPSQSEFSDHRVLISRRSAENKLPLALPNNIRSIGDLRRSPHPVIITITRPSTGRPIIIDLVQVFSVQALRAGLLEGRVTLSLPLHRTQFTRLPIVSEIPGRAASVPIRIILVRVVAGVRVVVRRILVPQSGRGNSHVHSFRLPVWVPIPVPAHWNSIVVEGTLGQRVHVLIGEIAHGRCVGIETLLMVHDPVHGILSAWLSHRTPSAGSPRPVARDYRSSFHSARRHRLRGYALVVNRRLRLRILDAVQGPWLLFLPFSLSCVANR